MASEIRANKQTNRVGLGTVTYTDTGIIVSGIVTANSFKGDGSQLSGIDASALKFGGSTKVQATNTGATITGNTVINGNIHITGYSENHFAPSSNNAFDLGFTNYKFRQFHVTGVNAGVVTATTYHGDGSNLTNLPAGAPVGGASTNTVFFENAKEVAVNYQITSTKNAMSAGPIAINAGIAVTVPSGCAWTIV